MKSILRYSFSFIFLLAVWAFFSSAAISPIEPSKKEQQLSKAQKSKLEKL
jgi:hypothetical protein